MIRILPVVLFALAAGCAGRAAEPATVAATRTASMLDSAGTAVGSASLLESRRGPLLVLKLQGISPGTHGLHVHAAGSCEKPRFESAGAHLNPTNRKHGARNPAGPHAGDLPNVRARADGTVDTTLTLSGDLLAPAALGTGAPARALVLHAKADDLMTDPSGNSGDRIVCGVLGK
ncbi:MAG: superoxide dismutase family protein [Gemmatimonadales bacterium]